MEAQASGTSDGLKIALTAVTGIAACVIGQIVIYQVGRFDLEFEPPLHWERGRPRPHLSAKREKWF